MSEVGSNVHNFFIRRNRSPVAFRFKSLNTRFLEQYYKDTKARFPHILFIIISTLAFLCLEFIRQAVSYLRTNLELI